MRAQPRLAVLRFLCSSLPLSWPHRSNSLTAAHQLYLLLLREHLDQVEAAGSSQEHEQLAVVIRVRNLASLS